MLGELFLIFLLGNLLDICFWGGGRLDDKMIREMGRGKDDAQAVCVCVCPRY